MAQKTWETVGFSRPDDGTGRTRSLGAFHICYRAGDKDQRKTAIARVASLALNSLDPIWVDHDAQQVFRRAYGSRAEHVGTYVTEPYTPPVEEPEQDLFTEGALA